MQLRPLLINTLSTIRSRYCSQLSASSSPSRILEKPGPCTCTAGFPEYCSTVGVPPKIRLRGQLFSTAAPTSPSPGYRAMDCFGTPAAKKACVIRQGVHGSCGPGFSTSPICNGMIGSQRLCTPGEFDGSTMPSTGVVA